MLAYLWEGLVLEQAAEEVTGIIDSVTLRRPTGFAKNCVSAQKDA